MTETPVTIQTFLEDLPAKLVITGKAIINGRLDAREERNPDRVVLQFRRETVETVRESLRNQTFDRIIIEDIFF